MKKLFILAATIPFCFVACHSNIPTADSQNVSFVTVSPDGQGFIQRSSKESFAIVGVNYDHDGQGRLIEEYWENEWSKIEGDFKEMAELGFNVVRIHLQFPKFMKNADETDNDSLMRLDRLLELAEKNGLYLLITGLGQYRKEAIPRWFVELSDEEKINAEAFFWKNVAERCKDSPAVLGYDLQNEPVINLSESKELVGPPFDDGFYFINLKGQNTEQNWTAFIRSRYGEEARLKARWPDFPRTGESFERVLLPNILDKERNEDFLDFAHIRALAWVKKMSEAIRTYDKKHLITVGLLPWSQPFFDLYSGFLPQLIAPYIDFVSLHVHLSSAEWGIGAGEAELAIRASFIGKPVVLEEFSFLTDAESRERFIERSKHSVAGYIGYYWGDTVKELSEKDGIKESLAKEHIERMSQLAHELAGKPPKRDVGSEPQKFKIKNIRLDGKYREKIEQQLLQSIADGQYINVQLELQN